jgi:hypothetical protein
MNLPINRFLLLLFFFSSSQTQRLTLSPVVARLGKREGEGDESVGERKGEKKRKDGRNKGWVRVCERVRFWVVHVCQEERIRALVEDAL